MTNLIKPDLSKDTTGRTSYVLWCSDGEAYSYDGNLTLAREHAKDPVFGFLALLQLEVDDHGVPVHESVVRRVEP